MPARDNQISVSTGYDNLHEGVTELAAQAPGLHSARPAAKAAGHDYVLLDGTPIETDRIATPGPTTGVDLWWSAKHKKLGGNIQVLTAPDGWPLWTARYAPAANTTPPAWTLTPASSTLSPRSAQMTDLGYEGEADTVVVAFKTCAPWKIGVIVAAALVILHSPLLGTAD